MRKVCIVGIGHTPFGSLSHMDLVDLMALASIKALEDAGAVEKRREIVDQVFVANMGSGRVNAQSAIASSLVSRIGLESCMAEAVENGPASGASAVRLGFMAIQSGMADAVLVTGGEMMNAVSRWVGVDFVATMLHHEAEYDYGMTLPSLAALFTRMYMHRYGVTGRELAMVAVKNHENASKNPYAHLKNRCTLEAIYDGENAHTVNPFIADPLRLYDICPVSDGAASLLLCAEDSPKMRVFEKEAIYISGIASATDTHCVHMRKNPLILGAVRLAARRAYAMAGLGPRDISFAELHDAFAILELAISEEVGFFRRGHAREALEQGKTRIDGSLPINTSGGLKAKGHPLGATGVSQVYELVKQLRGAAEPDRQVQSPKHGMAVNFGGFGNNIVVTICSRAEYMKSSGLVPPQSMEDMKAAEGEPDTDDENDETGELDEGGARAENGGGSVLSFSFERYGAQKRKIFALQCPKCGKLFYPGVMVCDFCHTCRNPLSLTDVEWEQVALEGPCTLLSWTRVYTLPEGFVRKHVDFCIVEFPNGLRASGQLEAENPEIGMQLMTRVDVVREQVNKDHYGFIFESPKSGEEGEVPAGTEKE